MRQKALGAYGITMNRIFLMGHNSATNGACSFVKNGNDLRCLSILSSEAMEVYFMPNFSPYEGPPLRKEKRKDDSLTLILDAFIHQFQSHMKWMKFSCFVSSCPNIVEIQKCTNSALFASPI